MKDLVRIVLRSGKDQSLKRYHPWVFSGAIKKIYGEPAEGDIVKVYSNQDEFLGTGHYQDSSITIRILSFKDEEIGEDFYITRIKDALAARVKLGLSDDKNTNVYRLVNAEGDGLPGLIIDYYFGTAVCLDCRAKPHESDYYFYTQWLGQHVPHDQGQDVVAA